MGVQLQQLETGVYGLHWLYAVDIFINKKYIKHISKPGNIYICEINIPGFEYIYIYVKQENLGMWSSHPVLDGFFFQESMAHNAGQFLA